MSFVSKLCAISEHFKIFFPLVNHLLVVLYIDDAVNEKMRSAKHTNVCVYVQQISVRKMG